MQKQTAPVFLSGHNIKVFDCPLLMNALEATGKVTEFLQCTSGFLDTRILFKTAMPGLSSYAQPYLVTHVTGLEYGAHNAVEDVYSLQNLLKKSDINVSQSANKCATFSVDFVKLSHENSKRVRKNLPSLKPLVSRKVLSASMARKAAGSDLNYSSIKLAYTRNGRDGVKHIFCEPCGIGARVTKSEKIIQAVAGYFAELQASIHEV